MAHNEITVEASAANVWNVLADGRNYGHWVVGSSEIREVEPGFPAPGTRFHHKVGWGPVKIADHTAVLEAEPGRHLKLEAKARPLGKALVTLELEEEFPGRTRILMEEDLPGDNLPVRVLNALSAPLIKVRNAESLRRLKAIAEGRGPHPEESAQP